MTDFAYRLTRYGGGRKVPAHYHDELGVGLVLAGGLAEQVGSSEEHAAPGSLVIKPRGAVHSNRFGPRGAVLLTIDQPQLLACGLTERSGSAWRWFHHPQLTRMAVSVTRELRSGDAAGAAEEAMVALLNAVTGLPSRTPKGTPPPWLRRVRDQLHAQPERRPSVARLACDAGVHPAHLTRRFRAAYGCSVSGYVRRLRIQEAASLVVAGGERLGDIAHALGFADQSHFCRTFHTELGLSPGAFRRLLDLEEDRTRFETFKPDQP